jgi:hypothetical protein
MAMSAKRGVSEALSSIIIIAIAVITGLSASVYINTLSNHKMQEYGDNVSNIINKNSEDLIILHAEYKNSYCNNKLAVWVYNAGSIDTHIIKAYLNDIDLNINNIPLPKESVNILCINVSIERIQSNEYTLLLESTYGNRDSIKVNING